ncbi:MarR family winged helix-turn-helix transcriptional regulator [Chitinophaga sancti]|uniref:DNA-binding transcriptional regulator, MarR family n=1 Tax=Chitinophaga sancti TaxID=1004 RepID=A0A1K1QYT7_9BACT|nr:MarR family transcriptional regulator [Chitinophaga sancti]WQD62103.1 MarR family transcriptional regulator [Chitinophaga sancti]WQG92328.1 MarR family transcriptional regulator [Chitinophaga sancti]SFW65063.1 DNA-binding transcriptional regulator, MarR family [Chitinophaga sancti]
MDTKDQVFSYIEPEENSGYLLWQVTMQWQLDMNRALSRVGLTLTQFSLMAGLYWLSQKKEGVTQQQLADYANTDKMMTSKVLAVLETKGIVERVKDPGDSRAKQLRITDNGVAALREAYRIVKQVDDVFFKEVEKDKASFDELLMRLIKR